MESGPLHTNKEHLVMKKVIFLILIAIPFSSFAIGGSVGGGARPLVMIGASGGVKPTAK